MRTTGDTLLSLAEQWISGAVGPYYFDIEVEYAMSFDAECVWIPGADDSETRANFCLLIREAIKGE